ncbi:unnamed protein product [Fraxinus pennsylvanica]|uniref:Uncharacterized protein n=1 Tax=Fraxinus pennsylvanica TaxID=56036 RepID=A0AAD2DRG9_9LAMI|nr:unnamed protein product [Fraxinus pennsylvanica]
MDLGCIDMGCIEKQKKETFLDKENSPKESGMSSSKPGKNKGSKDVLQSSLSALNKLTSQITKPPKRKTSPLNWFPRKKVDYLNRKIKSLQEVDGMNSTLDETLGDSNPHYSRVLREKIAVREAAEKAMEAQKAAKVEASWCHILKAARIESKDAETELSKAEKYAAEAFEAATAIGVIMNDIPEHAQKRYKMETVKGEESTSHTISASFETAFEVDKQVAAAVKAAFIKLANCPSINRGEFRELLRKISETPDTGENYHELSDFSTGCESDSSNSQDVSCDKEFAAERKSKYKRRQVLDKFSMTNLVEIMLDRLRCLKEDELASLATIVATSGLNEALVEAENRKECAFNSSVDDVGKPTSDALSRISDGRRTSWNTDLDGQMRRAAEAELPSLDKFLVKRLTRLERELLEAKKAGANKAADGSERDLDSNSDYEKLSLVSNTSSSQKDSSKVEEKTEPELPSLDKFLVKRLTRLERELLEAKRVESNKVLVGSEQVVNSKSDDEKLSIVENTSLHEKDSNSQSTLQKPSSMIEKKTLEGTKDSNSESTLQKPSSMIEKKTLEGTNVPDLGSILVKHSSKLEKEIEEGRIKKSKVSGMSGKNLERVSTMTIGHSKNVNETTEVPGLDKYLVKHLSRLEREVQEARNTKSIELSEICSITDSSKSVTSVRATDLEVISTCTDGDLVGKENMKLNQSKQGGNGATDYESLDKVLVKHVTRLEKEKMGLYEEEQTGMKLKRRNTNRETDCSEGSLDQILVKHKSRLEREKMAAAEQYSVDDQITHSVSRRQARERELQDAWGGLSLGNSMRPHVSRLERDKDSVDNMDDQITHSVSRRQARERELQEAWGGLSLGNSMRPHVSRLERDKDGIDNVDDQISHSVSRRQARERELQEAWGGLSLGNSMRPHVSRLERDKDGIDDQIRNSVSRQQARERELQKAWGGLSLGNSMRPHVSRLERDKARTCHNKRYHQKVDAPHEDLSCGAVDHTYEGSLRQVGSERSREKLVPRRQSGMPPSEMQPLEQSYNFLFMPTPGIYLTSGAQFTNYGPPLNEPASSTMGESPLKSMVEDLQERENQEKERKRATVAKNRRIVRGKAVSAAIKDGALKIHLRCHSSVGSLWTSRQHLIADPIATSNGFANQLPHQIWQSKSCSRFPQFIFRRTKEVEDLSCGAVDHTYEGSLRQVGSERSREKLVPRRQSGMPPSEMQPPKQSHNFLFMPTPGIYLTSGVQFTNYGPPLNEPANSTMGESPLKSMVEDLLRWNSRIKSTVEKSSEGYDFVRTLQMAGYGMIILGPSLHYWFNFVSRVFPKRDLLSTFKKMALGQTVYGPTMAAIFFSIDAALQDHIRSAAALFIYLIETYGSLLSETLSRTSKLRCGWQYKAHDLRK